MAFLLLCLSFECVRLSMYCSHLLVSGFYLFFYFLHTLGKFLKGFLQLTNASFICFSGVYFIHRISILAAIFPFLYILLISSYFCVHVWTYPLFKRTSCSSWETDCVPGSSPPLSSPFSHSLWGHGGFFPILSFWLGVVALLGHMEAIESQEVTEFQEPMWTRTKIIRVSLSRFMSNGSLLHIGCACFHCC